MVDDDDDMMFSHWTYVKINVPKKNDNKQNKKWPLKIIYRVCFEYLIN